MKATIRDPRVLNALGPVAVATYLRSKNWRQTEVIENKGGVWTLHSDGQDFEILLPFNRELRDFASRMSDLLRTLEVVESRRPEESRSQLDILTDITNATSDLLRIRLASANLEDGTLPIERGVRVVEHARDLLLAAACATVQPRALYQTKKATQAVDYLRQARIGQTARGSFVLIIQSEVPPRLALQNQSAALLDLEEPFERRVMLTLASAVTAARNAAQHAGATGNWQPFTDAVRVGVSANLCDAIAGLAEDGGADTVAMSFSWAPGRALLAQAPERVVVAPDMIPVLREGARIFRGTAPLEDFELRGVVVKLDRPEGNPSGRVTIAAVVDEKLRKVQIELPGAEYEIAIEAHRLEQPVYCEGELAREGRSYVLRNPRGFRIEEEIEAIPQ